MERYAFGKVMECLEVSEDVEFGFCFAVVEI